MKPEPSYIGTVIASRYLIERRLTGDESGRWALYAARCQSCRGVLIWIELEEGEWRFERTCRVNHSTLLGTPQEHNMAVLLACIG